MVLVSGSRRPACVRRCTGFHPGAASEMHGKTRSVEAVQGFCTGASDLLFCGKEPNASSRRGTKPNLISSGCGANLLSLKGLLLISTRPSSFCCHRIRVELLYKLASASRAPSSPPRRTAAAIADFIPHPRAEYHISNHQSVLAFPPFSPACTDLHFVFSPSPFAGRGDLLRDQGVSSSMANNSDGSFVRIVLDAAVGSAPRHGSWRTQPQPFVEHVITKSASYGIPKIPKIKGKKKMSQFVKKRLMQHAMGRKSGFVETKEGTAIISYGTYGPHGKIEY